MPTPQNPPALIKEMQERLVTPLAMNMSWINKPNYRDHMDAVVTDTANATLEYVKGVAAEMRTKAREEYSEFGLQTIEGEITALTDLIARLTSNPSHACQSDIVLTSNPRKYSCSICGRTENEPFAALKAIE